MCCSRATLQEIASFYRVSMCTIERAVRRVDNTSLRRGTTPAKAFRWKCYAAPQADGACDVGDVTMLIWLASSTSGQKPQKQTVSVTSITSMTMKSSLNPFQTTNLKKNKLNQPGETSLIPRKR